jgi:hypothetical protein
MSSGFNAACRVTEFCAAFANGKNLFRSSLREAESLLRRLTPAEIKIVEGAAK